MKLYSTVLLALSILVLASFSSCLKDECEREVTYLRSTPIFKTRAEIRAGEPVTEAPREMKNPTQFYYYNQHILIADKGAGIHIIDNTNPRAPQNVAFLKIEGAENMSIKNDILYVNNYIDLLALDVSNIRQATLISRTADVFDPIWEDVNNGQVLVEYRIEEVTEKMSCDQYSALQRWNGGFVDDVAFDILSSSGPEAGGANAGAGAGGGVGTGGSLARFTIIGDYLYAVSNTALDVISLLQPHTPQLVNTINLGWGIETIFPYQDKLFIGSNSGMFIFDNSNPAAPVQLSAFQHARACDPVFVKDNYAYVTLRDGNTCAGFVNQLDLVDISDLSNPKLERSFPMDNPHGLTIRGNHLTLCEGVHGLKAFDITDPKTLDAHQLATYADVHAVDAISLPSIEPITVVIGQDGFYQFSFNEATGFELLSKIATK